MIGLGSRDDGSIGNQGEVNTRVRNQVSLELVQINVKGTIETKRSSDGRNNLSNQAVKVEVRRTFNVQVTATDVIDGLVINHEGNVRVLKGGVGGQDGVVGFNNGSSNLRSRVDREFKLGLLTIINGETFHQESTETRTGATTEGVEDQETLKTGTVISQLADAVQDRVNQLFTNGVVTTSIVVGGIFLAGNQQF
jgi:hypothetical protein